MRVTQKNRMWRRNNLSFRKWRDRVCTYYASNYYWGERRGRRGGEGEKVVWSNVVTTRSEEFRLNFEKFSFLARPVLKGISLRVERTTKYDSASSTRFCTAREKDVFSKISRSNREIWINIKKRGGVVPLIRCKGRVKIMDQGGRNFVEKWLRKKIEMEEEGR